MIILMFFFLYFYVCEREHLCVCVCVCVYIYIYMHYISKSIGSPPLLMKGLTTLVISMSTYINV